MDMDTARQVLGYQLLRERREGMEGGEEGGRRRELDGVRTTCIHMYILSVVQVIYNCS